MATTEMVCGRCMTIGPAKAIKPKNTGDQGLGCLAIVIGAVGFFFPPLWILAGVLLVLALVRMVGAQAKSMRVEAYECQRCKAREMVPLDTPAGAELVARGRQLPPPT